jgi:hypothetical protein
MSMRARTERLALVQGWDDTTSTLRTWRAAPGSVLRPWVTGSLLVAVLLLLATWVVAETSTPDVTTPLTFAGVNRLATAGDYGFVLFRNALVLALHALACVAGFIAGSSLPVIGEGYSGVWRRVHELARPFAIAFVIAATLFSLGTQALVLGRDASTLAAQFGLSPGVLLATLGLHAVPELTALFLPLAAWSMASRRRRWDELLAATFVTVALAVPVLLAAAAVEVWVTPHVLLALIG